jgi:hypothetical protein
LGGRLGLRVGAEALRADAAVGRRDEGEQGVEPTTAVAAARQVTVIGMGHITWASVAKWSRPCWAFNAGSRLEWANRCLAVQLLLGCFLVLAPLVDIYLLKHPTRYTIINS